MSRQRLSSSGARRGCRSVGRELAFLMPPAHVRRSGVTARMISEWLTPCSSELGAGIRPTRFAALGLEVVPPNQMKHEARHSRLLARTAAEMTGCIASR